MKAHSALMIVALALASCTQVVTSTSTEVRPMRYALVEVTHPLASADSAIVYAQRALAAEKIPLAPGEVKSGVVASKPVHFAAEGDQPALDATVNITAVTRGTETRYRIYAAAVMPAEAIGGVDARLNALVQRLSHHLEAIIRP
jgi:hypothetical protein